MIDLLGLECCGLFIVTEIKGAEVPEDKQKVVGADRIDGFKVLYLPCPDCTCPANRIKLVQAREWTGGISAYTPAFDTTTSPERNQDGVIVLPEYGGWTGGDRLSFLDGPFNPGARTFGSEVCAVCEDGEETIACVSFSFDGRTRKLTVPDSKPLTPGDLSKYGDPGPHAEGTGAAGYITACSEPGRIWKGAVVTWEKGLSLTE